MNIVSNYDLYLIVHGCPQSAEDLLPHNKLWMNWLEGKLKEKGLNAVAPDMPVPWKPRYEAWKKELEKYSVTQNSMLIGHSCGGGFLVRWLLDTHKTVKKLILVAPAISSVVEDRQKYFYNFELPSDASEIADEIVLFVSNDSESMLESFELYSKALKPRVIRLENKGHFIIYTMGTNEFPELLEEVLAKKR
jgi:uncharacterized protein